MFISTALALEVMDKEWPLWLVLTGFLGLGFIGIMSEMAAARYLDFAAGTSRWDWTNAGAE